MLGVGGVGRGLGGVGGVGGRGVGGATVQKSPSSAAVHLAASSFAMLAASNMHSKQALLLLARACPHKVVSSDSHALDVQ
jgi:hypothetical protein